MLSDTQTLNASTYGGTATSTVLDKIELSNGKSAFTDATVASSTPRLFTVSHDEKTVNARPVKGHLVRYQQSFFPASGGAEATPSISITLKEPIGVAEVTNTVIEDMIGNAIAFFMTNLTKLRNSEP